MRYLPNLLISCLLITLNLIATNLLAQKNTLKIRKTTDFEISGKGDHKNWENTEWLKIEQRKKQNRVYQTHTKTLYSDSGIYFLFKNEDDKITNTLTEDFSNLFNEDVVEVFLWTDEKYPFYFEYELSPTNYELPILVPNVDGKFLGWKPWNYEGGRKTRHATHIAKDYWTAEFFIPYALLSPLANVPPVKGTKWRANMYRLDYDAGTSRWEWQEVGPSFHDINKYGTFVFE